MSHLEPSRFVRKTPVEKNRTIEGWQLRAGRAAAELSAQQMAQYSGLSLSSVRRAEDEGVARLTPVNQKALLDALADLGVSFGLSAEGAATVAYAPRRT